MFKKNLLIILLLIFSLGAIKSLLSPGFYTSHDGKIQAIRLYHFNKGLMDGQIPPRWAGIADNGYGYPLLNFTYQMPWFIGVPLLKLGFSLTDSIKGIFVIGYVLSGLFMFLWLKEKTGTLGGFFGAFLYVWAPYRFSNIYVRASLGEATVFMFLPLLFWGVEKSAGEKNKLWGIILIAIGLSGIILSHLMGLIIIIFPLLVWVVVNIYYVKQKSQALKNILFGLLLGVFLSSYYLFPAILEKKFTQANEILNSFYKDRFVSLNQLIYSKWDYGFDFPGTVNDGMSFQIGFAQWIVMIVSFFLLIHFLYKLIKEIKHSRLLTASHVLLTILFCLLVFCYSIFMMLPISTPLWQLIVNYSYFDYPWRFLGLSVFISSIAGAYFVSNVNKFKFALIILIIFVSLYTNRNHVLVNNYLYVQDKYFEKNTETTNNYDEYRPKTLNQDYIKIKRDLVEKNNDVVIKKIFFKSNSLILEGQAAKNTIQKINIAYFPGWVIKVNNKKNENIMTNEGVMNAEIPKGKFLLKAEFVNTPIRIISNVISLASLLIIALLITKKYFLIFSGR